MVHRSRFALAGILLVLTSMPACTDRPREREPSAGVVIDTTGDTVVVRTLAEHAPRLRLVEELRIGSVDDSATALARVSAIVGAPGGGIYVWDDGLRELRRYDAAGSLVRRIGREGAGPGEYRSANGIASLPDGSVALWDPRNSRVSIFADDGTLRTSWRWPTGLIMQPQALPTDSLGNILLLSLLPTTDESHGAAPTLAYLRVSPAGVVLDTLRPPAADEAPMLRAIGSRSSTGVEIPYTPRHMWIFTSSGDVAQAHGSRYAVHIARESLPPLRIEREVHRVAVSPEERSARRSDIVRALRRVDPGWRWSGPDIPEEKPHIVALVAADDGRLWVQRSVPSVREEPDDPADTMALVRWNEPATYDIFTDEGLLLGQATLPARTRLLHLAGEQVWAVQHDSLDIPYIVRYRVQPAR